MTPDPGRIDPWRRALPLAALLAGLGACRSLPPDAAPVPASPSTSTVTIDAPPQDWQPCLGQRVRVTAPLTISGNRNLRKRGELVVSFDGRLYASTEVARPGADAARVTRTPAELDRQLGKRVAGAAERHSNADKADNVGYRDAIDQQQATDPWRSSDHDPRLVGLRLRTP